ncbi:MAG TPA: ATP12 family protein, partial [Acetobacteraceae bacterium]|nr:ATP12 family protein [Acetobacteraceae bacterium]
MKRFWRNATLDERAGAWRILLDGKPMRLPDGRELHVDKPALAAALAEEWQAAGGAPGGEMSFEDVPLTRLAGTAQHRIAPDPAPTVTALARFAEGDALCYRAEHPEALVIRQHHAWQPWLDWAAATYGARLLVTRGIMPVEQPAESVAHLHQAVASLDAAQLAGLGIIVPALGSLVRGLAIASGALGADQAFDLAVLDEVFQESLWGTDEAALARRAALRAE